MSQLELEQLESEQEEGTYELVEQTVTDSEDDFQYDELPLDTDEDLEEDQSEYGMTPITPQEKSSHESKFIYRPESTDDFVRNFLVRLGMLKSLDAFQAEWYELQSKGKLKAEDVAPVPDVYLRNQELRDQVAGMRKELENAQLTAEKAKGVWDKLRKERDFHRMHHKRVQQEKQRLVADIEKLKKVHEHHEGRYNELSSKYSLAMKEKMLMRLERDRLFSKTDAFQKSMESGGASPEAMSPAKMRQTLGPRGFKSTKPSMPSMGSPAKKSKLNSLARTTQQMQLQARDSKWPADERSNPYLSVQIPEPNNLIGWVNSKTFGGHQLAVSGIALHPKKSIVATVSDDNTWKIWSIPNGDLIMSGEGHKDWVSGVAFHPRGTHLATCSGDRTVKIWDFVNACCTHTFTDHSQAVWSVAFHDSGDFLASGSMDHSIRLFDLASQRCRNSYRGHVDSVNKVVFQPYSNIICSASGDKTVSLWDMRTAQCIQTFYGHNNSVTNVTFSMRGDTLASCDSDGIVKLWDVRQVQQKLEIETGNQPVNVSTFDRSGTLLAAGSEDGNIYIYKAETGDIMMTLKGHSDSIQDLTFDVNGKYMVSAGSDATFRIWQ